ncbi:hypothetical protein EGW08_019402 [Elysia chlorotica]|uniref:Uncharacterized protein n=1 Tax=Elysia chlorotica TaxID=188477 RepID=A0A3S1H5U9_ELYCH|nr:hypothetical protein EGW08_019402 [Elysia chlorotica]
MCAVDPNKLLPGAAMSRGQVCRKFRRCNYAMSRCQPFMQSHSVVPAPATLPYCRCREWAESDAREMWCPPSEIDDVDCDTPRRSLEAEQRKLACLCQYRIKVVHPYVSSEYRDKSANLARKKRQTAWRVEDRVITAPALNHRSC